MTNVTTQSDPIPPAGAGVLAGALAAATSIAVAELVAGLIPGAPSLVVAIGTLVIDFQPAGAKDVVVELFGTNDKLALNVVIVAAALAVAALLGIVARRQIRRADAGFVAAGLVALVAAWRQPLVSLPLAAITVVVALAAGLAALRLLLAAAQPRTAEAVSSPSSVATDGTSARRLRRLGLELAAGLPRQAARMPDWGRRRFLMRSAAVAVTAVVAGGLGRALLQRRAEASPAVSTVLPSPRQTTPPLTPAESLNVPGLTPLVVPNESFYRIDTALLTPHIEVNDWRLTVRGMVDRTVELTYAELGALPLLEQYVTIACVSNTVGGDLVGNALWTGVRLRDVLSMAGIQPGATQIVGRSADGWTAGFPTEHALNPAREPMIALLMNRQPLPVEHGYPARLIVPGLFGYVSATKWLTEIELTTLEAFDGYWIPLGWAKEGPILTQSRIDVPRHGDEVRAGEVTIAGVAWAPDRGISRVEISIDSGPWQACTTSQPIAPATWLQWLNRVPLAPGRHDIEVRATDGTGVVQTAETSPPAPDGARGHHNIQITAS
jgi:DMSO/TMAO reductase YedYZ molybdopterin-dependent catalytic subunit